jgi:release factor glutamine methyltransferase
MFAGLRGPFDLVLFNPPYLPTRQEERIDDWLEFALDGGETGREVIRRFAAGVYRVLAPGGRILLIVSSLTGVNEVCCMFREEGYCAEAVRTEQIFGGEKLVVLKCTQESIS